MLNAEKIVADLYAAFAKGDVDGVLGSLASDIEWIEAAGGPYGGTYTGPQAVLEGVFMRLAGEWSEFAAVPLEFFSRDNVVVVIGEYGGTFQATGKSFRAPFVHVWRFCDGKVATFTQHTDTVLHRAPMQ